MSLTFWAWSHYSFVAASTRLLIPSIGRQPLRFAFLLIGLVLLAMLPMQGTDASGLALGVAGPLSASTLVLLTHEIMVLLGYAQPRQASEVSVARGVWIAAGAALYPAALGFLDIDVYALGYGKPLAWGVLAGAGVAIALQYRVLAVCLSAAVLVQQAGLTESPNLWDALVDPWLFLTSWVRLLAQLHQPSRLTADGQPIGR